MIQNDRADRGLAMRKARAQLDMEITDEALQDWIGRAELYFFARTNRRAVPVKATLLWADITAAMIRQAGAQPGEGAQVASIKRGDTTVQYAAGADVSSVFSPSAALSQRIDFYRAVRAK